MAHRTYNQRKRAEAAEETRGRIVRATFELHAEKGVSATSYRDIAERADVSVGTVYHHFATYDHVIEACGRYTVSTFPPPSVEIVDGIEGQEPRIATAVAAWCDAHRSQPTLDKIRADRDLYPRLESFFRDEERQRRSFARAVLGRGASATAVRTLAALLAWTTYRSFREIGFSHRATIDEITALALDRCISAPTSGAKKRSRR